MAVGARPDGLVDSLAMPLNEPSLHEVEVHRLAVVLALGCVTNGMPRNRAAEARCGGCRAGF